MATILCVEPDPPLGDLLTCALRRDGCTVLEEEAGAPVPRLVRYGAVDLVVLDLALPDQPCLAVLAVRASTEAPILLTGTATEQEVVRGLALGADDHLGHAL